MRPYFLLQVVLIANVWLLYGCGSEFVTVNGTIVNNGQPIDFGQAIVRLVFSHQDEATKTAEPYMANVNSDGTFTVPGKRGKGIPRGKYTISMTLPPDLFDPNAKPDEKGKIVGFTREITSSQSIDLDVAKPES